MFNIGDKVKYVGNNKPNRNLKNNIGIVTKITTKSELEYVQVRFEQSTYFDEDGFYQYWCYGYNLEKMQ